MSRPEGLTDEQWNEVVDAKCRASERQHQLARVAREGFEVTAYDQAGSTCERSVSRKIKGKWGHEPCGAPALVVLNFAGPQNPVGTPVALCKECVGWLAKDMIGYLTV